MKIEKLVHEAKKKTDILSEKAPKKKAHVQ